jgi:hypothetical protein
MLNPKVGEVVVHSHCPSWGPGKVLLVDGQKVHVYFRDALEEQRGGAIKLLDLRSAALVPYDGPPDPWLERLPSLVRNGRIHSLPRPRLTFVQAVEMFHAMYPGGFADPAYIRDEREYKWSAHVAVGQLGLSMNSEPTAAGAEFVDGLLKALKGLNLLALQERLAFRDGLLGSPGAAEAYRTALTELCASPVPARLHFAALQDAVEALPNRPGTKGARTWPVLTLVPFIARPDIHILLKPDMSKLAADRLAFDLLYESQLNWGTYERLLELAGLLMERLRPFGAADYIDIQSFMWLTAADRAPQPSARAAPEEALPNQSS